MALIRPMEPTWMRSSTGWPREAKRRARLLTSGR